MNTIQTSKPLHILVVEDNYGDFLLLKESIGLSSIPVSRLELADHLEPAIQYVKQNKPDIIFLDLYLPDSNGLASFDQLKKHINGSAVIILSGLSDTKTSLEAIAQGAQDYLAKGEFDEKLLEKTITYAMERRRNMEKLRQANERYRLVTRATNDLVWDWDLATDEIYRDEQAVKDVYGVASNGAINNITEFNKRIHKEDADRIAKLVNEIKQSMFKDFFEIEYQFQTDTGTFKYIYDRGYVVRNHEGKPIRLIGAAQDITEKRKLQIALEESRLQQQRAITEATIKGQENEREQLGIELHDNINQILATSKLYLDHAISGNTIRRDMLLQSKELIEMATAEIRQLSHKLLPPSLEEFGLVQALNELADTITKTGVFQIERQWANIEETKLQRDQKLTIYRIVQEQMNNIIKHAGASNVLVSICLINSDNGLQLLIKDNGRGFDPSQKRNGVGLRNIISRAELLYGTVSIKSSPGEGCELKVIFPVVA
jgi:two-component system, NarL family, sensor histidine kinase UhpB